MIVLTTDDKECDKNFTLSCKFETTLVKNPCDTFSFISLNYKKLREKSNTKLSGRENGGKRKEMKNKPKIFSVNLQQYLATNSEPAAIM